MILYLDTFALLFRAYYSVRDLTSEEGVPTGALFGLSNSIFRIIGELQPDHIVACLDRPEETFRQQMSEGYKANREAPEEDMVTQINLVEDVLTSYGIHVVSKAGYEADDLLGTLATQDAKKDEVVIVSCDGDIFQLTVHPSIKVYFLRKGMSDFLLYDESSVGEKNGYPAKYIIDYKGLAGDPSDNIIGVSGIGDTYAKRLILAYGDLEHVYNALEGGRVKEDFGARIEKLLTEGKKNAFLSKELATIHTDISISPPHVGKSKWKDYIVVSEAQKTLQKYNFNSLSKKLSIITGIDSVEHIQDENKVDVSADGAEEGVVDKVLEQETAIALWVYDATQTNAAAGDILVRTQAKNLKDAMEWILATLKKQERLFIWEDIEKPLISVIKDVEEVGVQVDVKLVESLHKKYTKHIELLKNKIFKLAGEEFNLNSPKQLAHILFDVLSLIPKGNKKTSSGARTTKEAVLIGMKDMHPAIPLILEYRRVEKLRSTYIDALPKYIDSQDRIHAQLLQNGTVTGRFSSRNPNLQNIPVGGDDGKEIRDIFIAKEGYDLVAIDYSQIQLRIAAILSGEENLLSVFREHGDVHTSVASQIFNVPIEEVSKDQRSHAKVINFSILYGAGVTSLQQSIGISRSEVQSFLDAYKRALPTLFQYLDSIKKKARESGEVETAFGRVRPVEGIQSSLSFVSSQAERMAISSVIQGTEADVIKLAMIEIHTMLQEGGFADSARMVLQIHDELLFEIKPSVIAELLPKIITIMESIYPKDKKPISLSVDVKRGRSWGSLEPYILP